MIVAIKRFRLFLRRYTSQTSGATAIEYGLIIAGLCVFLMIIIFSSGGKIESVFGAAEEKLVEGAERGG